MESSMTKTLDIDFQLLDTRELEPLVNDEESNSELDGCFWIIGRVGFQTLKYGNEFDVFGDIKINSCEFFLELQGNSYDNIGKDKDSWKTVKQYFT
ncbi:unnamed protein product [Rhizophagus irregularis]|nr:unnamed protein product [Rhizophagus irregularis]